MKKRTITVGRNQGDIRGKDNRAIQKAIDALAAKGGGTVKVLPGEYVLNGSIRMRSNIHLLGDRDRTILKRCAAVASLLKLDADIGQKQITPVNAAGFKAGMGISCHGRRVANSTMPWTLVRKNKGILYLDSYIEQNYNAEHGEWVTNMFPLIQGCEIENVRVEGFTLDSKVKNIAGVRLVWGGGLYFRRCKHGVIREITSINCNGDGLRWGQSEHVTVEDCEVAYNTHYGLHPGSHSPFTTIQRCHIHHNGSDGLYACWGVSNSKFVDNVIHHNGFRIYRNGFCIGHKDTDCLIARNRIFANAKHGIHVRKKTEGNGAHRNVYQDNIIEDNGLPFSKVPSFLKKSLPREELGGCGVYVAGITHDLVFENNIVRETRQGKQRHQLHGFYLEPGVRRLKMKGNHINRHPLKTIMDNSGSRDNKLQKIK